MFIDLYDAFCFFTNWLTTMANRDRVPAEMAALLRYARSQGYDHYNYSFSKEYIAVAYYRDGQLEFAECFRRSN